MALLATALVVLVVACTLVGSVHIPATSVWSIVTGCGSGNEAWDIIILNTRLPMVGTALLAGAALSISGLLLQTTFNNPLAGPSILGVSTGAGLGVAIVMLAMGGSVGSWFGMTASSYVAILMGALAGAAAVLFILILLSSIVKDNAMLLITGILVSYLASSIISLLNSLATEDGISNYVAWGFGTFAGVTVEQMPLFATIIIVALVASSLMAKPLNAMLMGWRYATNMGVNVSRTRNVLLLITGILTAVVTAFCGPIGFIGLVVPHVARLMLGTSNHHRLIPATMLAGSCTALLCSLIGVAGDRVIPINAITPVIGVPIIIYLIVNRRKIQYFN